MHATRVKSGATNIFVTLDLTLNTSSEEEPGANAQWRRS